MSTLSRDQVGQLLSAAGFDKSSQTYQDMIGICYAESGGDPSQVNNNPATGDLSYGLWQINMIGSLGPTRRKQFGISSNEQLLTPSVNAHAAYVIYKNQGLNAWTTYKNGDYLKHMTGITSMGNAKTSDSAVGSAASGILDQFSGISSSINAVGQNLFKGFADVVGVIVAIALLLGGIAILLVQSKSGKRAVKTAAKVAVME